MPAGLPDATLPNPLGVNIHFTDPRPGEMEMLAQGGFRWVRMDFGWESTEKERGRYDFSAYDRLLAALDRYHIRPVFILDYANPNYDNSRSPDTDEGRAGMARWAAAAVTHYKGRGIVWEMYNEPNIGFWRPKPNVDDYVKLALAVGRAIRAAAPGEMYVGPATSTLDFRFLETCFKGGLLTLWDAVSVHPYRQNDPETVEDEYRRLRLLIAKYAPVGKRIPILSGEWGYSAGWSGMDETKQGRMLAREYLVNLANDIPISIWYDWHDDGLDPKEPEHHFGTVRNPYHAGAKPVYEPKPAYLAARTLSSFLSGYRFNKRLWTGSPDDYVLLFRKGADIRLAAWTRSPEPRDVRIAASPGQFRAVSPTGAPLSPLTADATGLRVRLTVDPVYLAPERTNDVLRMAAAWQRLPLELPGRAPSRVYLKVPIANPSAVPIRLQYGDSLIQVKAGKPVDIMKLYDVTRSQAPSDLVIRLRLNGMEVAQRTEVIALNPLVLTPLAPGQDSLPVRISNPSIDPVDVEITAAAGENGGVTGRAPVTLTTGRAETFINFPMPRDVLAKEGVSFTIHENGSTHEAAVADLVTERTRIVPIPGSRFTVSTDGDSKVAADVKLTETPAPPGLPSPYGTPAAMRIDYRFDPGWKFLEVRPDTALPVDGKPNRFGIWLYGDRSGNVPRLRFTDATGQTFQPDGDAVTWTGWRWITFPMDGSHAGHWGGPNDGSIHYPIHWDSLFLLDNATRARTAGTVYLFGPTLFY